MAGFAFVSTPKSGAVVLACGGLYPYNPPKQYAGVERIASNQNAFAIIVDEGKNIYARGRSGYGGDTPVLTKPSLATNRLESNDEEADL